MSAPKSKYKIQYTKDKRKKSKVWQDGFLVHNTLKTEGDLGGKLGLSIYGVKEDQDDVAGDKMEESYWKVQKSLFHKGSEDSGGVLFLDDCEFETSKFMVRIESVFKEVEKENQVKVNEKVKRPGPSTGKFKVPQQKPKDVSTTDAAGSSQPAIVSSGEPKELKLEVLFTEKMNKIKQNKKFQDGYVKVKYTEPYSGQHSMELYNSSGDKMESKRIQTANNAFQCPDELDLGRYYIQIDNPPPVTTNPVQRKPKAFKPLQKKTVSSMGKPDHLSRKVETKKPVPVVEPSFIDLEAIDDDIGITATFDFDSIPAPPKPEPVKIIEKPKEPFAKGTFTSGKKVVSFTALGTLQKPVIGSSFIKKFVFPSKSSQWTVKGYLIGLHNCLQELVQLKINEKYSWHISTTTSSNRRKYGFVDGPWISTYNEKAYINDFGKPKLKKDDFLLIKPLEAEPDQFYLAKSTWFASKNSSSSEIELLSCRMSEFKKSLFSDDNEDQIATKRKRKNKEGEVKVMHLGNAGTEMQMLELLKNTVEESSNQPNDDFDLRFPIIKHLLPNTKSKLPFEGELASVLSKVVDHLDDVIIPVIDKFKLNEEQEYVVRRFVHSLFDVDLGLGNLSNEPVMLCQGVFGSGKSYLIGVLIIILYRIFTFDPEKDYDDMDGSSDGDSEDDDDEEEANRVPLKFKVLVTSNTNVAVDRILITLKKLGFDKFCRLGKADKVDKSIKKAYVKNASINKWSSDAQQQQKPEDEPEKSDEEQNEVADFEGVSNDKINAAFVIGTTCLSAMNVQKYLGCFEFPICIIDEASQLTECTSIIPMILFNNKRVLLIGDDKQLSPTVPYCSSFGSSNSDEAGIERSLFSRLKADKECVMLRRQYRVHSNISDTLSNPLFYDNLLINCGKNGHVYSFPSLVFVDLGEESKETFQNNSYVNKHESEIIIKSLDIMVKAKPNCEIGVISMYKSQTELIRKSVRRQIKVPGMNKQGTKAKGYDQDSDNDNQSDNNSDDEENEDTADESENNIPISTVDAFQGQETDVILLSTVRANPQNRIGFSDDSLRLNVAFSRAKSHLIVFGSGKTLTGSRSDVWSKIFKKEGDHSGIKVVTEAKWMDMLRKLK